MITPMSLVVLVEDFDLNGNLGCAYIDLGAPPVLVLAGGRGDGVFRAPEIQSIWRSGSSLEPLCLCSGHFNGDSYPDLAIADYFEALIVLRNDESSL
jgi:hypothetical protein